MHRISQVIQKAANFLRLTAYLNGTMSESPKIKPDSQDSRHAEQTRLASDTALLSRLNAVRLIVVTFIMVGYTSTMAIGPGSREWLNLF